MSTLYVTEYQYVGYPQGGGANTIAAGQEPAVTVQTVSIGGGSVQSAAFQPQTKFVRLHCDAICSVAFGANPTATTSSERLAANQTEFFGVVPGQKVAVISNT